ASGQAGHVRSDLEALLDSMTPLYKARLDALADLPRKLLAHILGHWAPMSLAQLADASQVAKTSISPQLQRLELEGLIQKTTLHGTTRSGYQAAERFFNIWYLMRLSPRRQRTRLSWLVEFMRLWFSSDELCHLARTRLTTPHGRNTQEWDYDCVMADALPTHLMLNNQQLALDALSRLAHEAEQGSNLAASQLRAQVLACTAMGLGERLADWMRQSPHVLYLQPMIQALYTLADAKAKLQDLPVEVQQMADAVVQATQTRLCQP
ncbi:MAG: MarR family transcriptional regulator, partial [Burkholderiales bacterium]|nr:MarR family transcriptional regulator [Burkholderiales bacterium]